MLRYNLDISIESKWFLFTPHPHAKNLPFRTTEAGDFIAGKDYFTERSGKNIFQMIYTTDGAGVLHIRNKVLSLYKNHGVFFHCDEYHMYKTNSEEGWKYKWVHFDGPSCSEYFSLINKEGIAVIPVMDPGIEASFDQLMKKDGVLDIQHSMQHAHCVENILYTLAKERGMMAANMDLFGLNRAIVYIQNNFRRVTPLDELAEMQFLSKYHFLRRFKLLTGLTPHEYLLRCRINEAKRLLKTSAKTIAEIGFEVGFADTGNFTRNFKKINNVTPCQYRKNEVRQIR